MKILMVYYSLYGHVYQMAKAVAEGAASICGEISQKTHRLIFAILLPQFFQCCNLPLR